MSFSPRARGNVTRAVQAGYVAIERAVQLAGDEAELSELYWLAILAYRDGRERGESRGELTRLRMRLDLAFLLWRNVSCAR